MKKRYVYYLLSLSLTFIIGGACLYYVNYMPKKEPSGAKMVFNALRTNSVDSVILKSGSIIRLRADTLY